MNHVVTDCGKCPMSYDGYCLHPSNQSRVFDVRIRDTDEYEDGEPHPQCPLRTEPLTLSVKP